MRLSRKLELESILLVLLSLCVLYVVFFRGYYFIRPSYKGEKILTKLGIPYPTVIAHRGASYKAPESTEPAYIEAHRTGAAYVEVDIRITKAREHGERGERVQ